MILFSLLSSSSRDWALSLSRAMPRLLHCHTFSFFSIINDELKEMENKINKFGQKIKIFCLRWDLTSRLIRICWIRSDLHFFCFGPYSFRATLVRRDKIACLRWNLRSRLIPICWIRWLFFLFHFGPKMPVWGKFDRKKSKLSV